MTQSLFSVLCAIFMLFSSVFGCSQGGILPTGLPNEKEPSAVEGTVYTRVDGVQNSVFYIAELDIEFRQALLKRPEFHSGRHGAFL